MDTKLKNSIKEELTLYIAWVLWGTIFTVTTNFLAKMADLEGNIYKYARVCVIMGILFSFILGIAVIRRTKQYITSVWSTPHRKTVILDKIPIEVALVIAVYLGLFWYQEELFWGGGRYLLVDDSYYNSMHRKYVIISEGMRQISEQLMELAVMGLAVWTILRQSCYDTWKKTSIFYRMYQRYHLSSPLGRKLTRKRGLFWVLVGIVFVAGFFAAAFFDSGDPDVGVVCGGIAVIAQILVIAYQKISGMLSKDVTAIVEQIRAISDGEPLDDVYRVSQQSMFYEPFHQLEELDAAVARSAEKQLQAERLKIDLITNVSHDLKTPLTSMVGYIDLLKQEELSPEAKDYVDIIAQKQEVLKEMIQNLFELSKSTSGVSELKMETLDMRKLVEQILGDMEDRIEESGMTVRSAFDDPPLLFAGDNEKMYRVVQNLLENALKYSLEHTRIYVDVRRAGERLVLQMKNISNYEMDFDADEITGRFVRGDRARTTEGHGLGLAIASSFTQNMGGILNVAVDGDLFKVTVEFPAVSQAE